MYQWAQLTHNDQLRTTAQWLYARETQSALAYYTNVDLARSELAGYEHTIFSLLWSGKADYATFFDAAPESKLAIQVIPMNPGAAYLGTDSARVSQNLAQVVRETGQAPSKFKDFLIMYKSLADPKGALADASALGDADIDSANSRSYLFAWLYTQAQK
jgi:endoglucanase Acf2